MVYEITLKTEREDNLYSITDKVRAAVEKSGAVSGLCTVYCPHTTAGITINENADPDVVRDLLFGLDRAFPKSLAYKHGEGNSHAHLKSSCVGCQQSVIIENGKLLLGVWQGIYFCEFDGPRTRKFFVKITKD